MSSTTLPARTDQHRLRGLAAPGFVGYLLAFLASAVALGVITAVGLVLGELGSDIAWAATDVIPTLFFLPLGVALLATLYGWPAAIAGCLLVHLACLRVRSQVLHVLAAALAGLAAGWVYQVWFFGWTFEWLWLQLGLATAIGRAAVIPLARRR